MKSRGFTLIEMIVSLGIFSVVAVISLGALMRIISANHKAQAIQSAFTNLNFALESMSREIRMGANYYCNPNGNFVYNIGTNLTNNVCSIGTNSAIFFESSKTAAFSGGTCRLVYAYRFRVDGSKYILEKAQQSYCTDTLNTNSFTEVISPNITITNYKLGVIKATSENYPKVFIRISGEAGVKEKEKTFFDVQTSISQRIR